MPGFWVSAHLCPHIKVASKDAFTDISSAGDLNTRNKEDPAILQSEPWIARSLWTQGKEVQGCSLCVQGVALIHYITVEQGAGSRSDSRQYVALLWCQVDSLCATCGSRCCVVVLLRSPPPMCCGLCESLVTVCVEVPRSASNHNHLGSGGWVTWVLGTPETPLWPSLPCMGSQGDSIDSHYHRAWEEPEATGWWRHPDFEKCFDNFVDKMQSRVLHFLLLRPL